MQGVFHSLQTVPQLDARFQHFADHRDADLSAIAAVLNADDKSIRHIRIVHKAGEHGIGFFIGVHLAGAGFGTDTNKVCLLYADGQKKDLPLLSKQEVADKIIDEFI